MRSSDQRWRLLRTAFSVVLLLFFLPHNLSFGLCFNTEALALMKFKERIERDPFGALINWGELHHCSWSGVVCSHDGRVVILNLRDLSLQGTLAPELGKLTHLKSLILRNNSFSGKVPEEVTELQELEILDLYDNNFGQPFPFGRRLLQLNPNPPPPTEDFPLRIFLSPPPPQNGASSPPPAQDGASSPPPPQDGAISPPPQDGASPPAGVPAETPVSPPAVPAETPVSPPAQPPPAALPPPVPSLAVPPVSKRKNSNLFTIIGVLVGVLGVTAAILVFFILWKKKVRMIKPWATKSLGEHQDVVITGVPKLKLSELETACEDFSNIIGSTPSDATIYKGTLSTGSEIAALSLAHGSLQDWSADHETQFREKIQRLSQVDHKNFLNVIGYCHEDEPFNRMIVFEYAPYGSLYEHLHAQDAEHLDWPMRLRIAMGIAYCVEHMQSLNPKPILDTNLNSSSIYLTTDYAAKVTDFTFLNSTPIDPLTNYAFSFGVILHEIITGKNPDTGSDSQLNQNKPTRELVDPSLKSFDENVLEKLWEVVLECLKQSPEMKEVVVKLREITGITAEGALPRLSPVWWAELEIISTEAN